MRQILSTALVALFVAALTAVSVSALAQSEPATNSTYSPAAGLNADTVDHKHAVGFTNKAGARRNKLVATNKYGLLPSNIVKPLWGAIKNKPAGFADGVDDQGVTGVTVTRLSAADTIPASSGGSKFSPDCPSGSAVVGGGYYAQRAETTVPVSQAIGSAWYVFFENPIANPDDVTVFVQCLSVTPGWSLTTAGKATSARIPKRASR
jgi:hypothetical protein